ncbi:phosphatase PAP2 family protein [Sulfurimonas sp.]|uniref:phosphatase PAP2 family protein n=1 Tax=Sulfurimonas sp. TaxID=2022749 RepID=UPI0025EAA362|nr:phosphatase PAP2 family protein [Sulfurimonas sp.]MDD5158022.1 phosphatase PAP2 family protein [Sulfurimonas sp.]
MKAIFYDWGGLNVWLFHLINNIRFEFLDKIMLTGTTLGAHELFGPYLALLSVFCLIMLLKDKTNTLSRSKVIFWISPIMIFSIGYILDASFVGAVKVLLDFPRPPLALGVEAVNIVGRAEFHHSFPSGHSSFAMLMLGSIWSLLIAPWQKVIGIIFVIWVGLSRISLGAHFPADVLAGWLSSLIIVIFARYIINYYLTKKI